MLSIYDMIIMIGCDSVKGIRKIFSDMDKVLLVLTIVMLVYGLLNIVTASSREAISQDVSLYHYFFKQSEMLLIALCASLVIINVDTKHYGIWAFIAYGIIFFILLLLLFNGEAHRGSKNWIQIFGVQFQPSEFAKPVIIVTLSVLFDLFYVKLRTKGVSHSNLIWIIIIIGSLFPALVFLQKDFGTSMILLGIFGVMFLGSPILKSEKFNYILFIFIFLILSVIILLLTGNKIFTEEQLNRFAFFNPCSNYEDGGYQVCNGMIAINDGGLLGVGIGKSKQKYSYIPEPHTDSVFAIITEEYGFIFCTFIFIIYVTILKRIFMIASKANMRGRYICLGVGTYMFLHILINLGGLFGIMPLTGVPLPFLSYGGSFSISLICSLALVQRVSIENKNRKEDVI